MEPGASSPRCCRAALPTSSTFSTAVGPVKTQFLHALLYRRKVGAHGQHTDDGAPVLPPRPAQGRMLGFAERHPLALGRAQQVP